MLFIRQMLTELEIPKLSAFPLIDTEKLVASDTHTFEINGTRLRITDYKGAGIEKAQVITRDEDARPVTKSVKPLDGQGYMRVDILNNGSFLELRPLQQDFNIPSWVWGMPPSGRWGV